VTNRRAFINRLSGAAVGALALPSARAAADVVRIGVLADMSGLFSDMTGRGSVQAVRFAVEDFGGAVNGKQIEIVSGDHQNKPDIASALARKWFQTDGVDVIVNMAGSATALAVVEVAKLTNKVGLVTGALSSRLSNEACSDNHVHYGFDTYAASRATTRAVIESGRKRWFFITADYAFGHALQSDAERFIKQAGGEVIGSVRHPLNTSDFSSFVLQAQASKADVIGIANGGSDLVNTMSSLQEFKVAGGKQSVVPMLLFITDLHAMGPAKAQNALIAMPFYWDRNDQTRAFAKRFFEKIGRMPGEYQAADYSATLQYLRTIAQVGWEDGRRVVSALKNKPLNDFYANGGTIRPDGVLSHDLYLSRVKAPAESRYPWDYYEIVATIRGEDAFQPLSESRCPALSRK
jgi:branched-chain amino acid transport system substrate-binding protein